MSYIEPLICFIAGLFIATMTALYVMPERHNSIYQAQIKCLELEIGKEKCNKIFEVEK